MSRAAWRSAAAALPLVPLAAMAVERVPVPVEAPPPAEAPAPATSGLAVPEALRRLGIESWWDVVGFSPWTASLGLTFDEQQQRLRAPGGDSQRYSSTLWSESLTIQNGAISVIDPRLFSASLSLGLLLQQERQQSVDQHTSQSGHLVNYAFEGTFLPEGAYNASLSAVRNKSLYVLPSGATTDAEMESRAVAFHMREDNFLREREILPYFSANLRAGQQYERQVTRSGGQTYRQDDRRDSVVFDFQNGGETSDLNFQYQYNQLANNAYREGSYQSHSANLGYSLDFGPTLNRRWDSRLNYYSRRGDSSAANLTNFELDEFLTIDHSVERSSSYNYQLSRQDTPFGSATTHSGGAQLYQQVYSNLALTGAVTGFRSSLPGGTITSAGATGNGSYNHSIPGGGHLSVAMGGGYVVTNSAVPGGRVQVTDAAYAVPQAVGAGSAILLNDRNIVAASIVVVVIKGGARVAAHLEIDYTLLVDGDRTSIVPSPVSAVMLPGDPLNVSYAYEVNADSKYATLSRSASITADWSWIGATLGHDESEQRPISGGDATLLVDQKRQNALFWLRGAWDTVQARAGAGVVRYDSTRLAYVERRLDQYVSWTVRPNLQLNLSANEYRTEYRQPEHTTDGGGVRLDLQWSQGAWLTTGYASRRTYRDTLQPHETIDEAGLRFRRTWTKLDLAVAVGAQKRERGEASSVNGFFHFGAVRRF